MFILQESCVDSFGSLVVYCPVDLPLINIAMSGEDTSCVPCYQMGLRFCQMGRRSGKEMEHPPVRTQMGTRQGLGFT